MLMRMAVPRLGEMTIVLLGTVSVARSARLLRFELGLLSLPRGTLREQNEEKFIHCSLM